MDEHTSHSEHEPKTKPENELTIPRAIIINGFIIAAAIIIAAVILKHEAVGGVSPTASAPSQQAVAAGSGINVRSLNMQGVPFIGNPNAPLVLAYWSDYQSPSSKEFEATVLPDIMQNYVTTGQVAVAFKDFPLLGSGSITAAVYGRAVWELYPSQYFAWRTAMMDAEGTAGFGDAASIEKITATVPGIDADKVEQAVGSRRAIYLAAINSDQGEAAKLGATTTPVFVTGTEFIPGTVSYATLSSDFDAQLKQ